MFERYMEGMNTFEKKMKKNKKTISDKTDKQKKLKRTAPIPTPCISKRNK